MPTLEFFYLIVLFSLKSDVMFLKGGGGGRGGLKDSNYKVERTNPLNMSVQCTKSQPRVEEQLKVTIQTLSPEYESCLTEGKDGSSLTRHPLFS